MAVQHVLLAVGFTAAVILVTWAALLGTGGER